MNIADYVIIIELLIKIILAPLSAFLAFLSVAFLSVFLALLSVSPFVWKPFCLEAFLSGHGLQYELSFKTSRSSWERQRERNFESGNCALKFFTLKS